jgi:hypothetical protein
MTKAATLDGVLAALDEVDLGDAEMINLADALNDVNARERAILKGIARKGKSYEALVALAMYRAVKAS